MTTFFNGWKSGASAEPGVRPSVILLRRALQLAVLAVLIRLALGHGQRAFEAFCPFGGAEAAWGLFRERSYTCTLSEMNVAMLIGLLALVALAGKAFCAWVCPIGFMNELLFKLGRRLPWIRRLQLPWRADQWLRFLRYPVLALVLILTWRAGELILRGYDPFFLLFSGFGHGALPVVSWVALGLAVSAALVVPMFWCRLLCPLGAVMDALARFAFLRVHRSASACNACGACDRACLQRLRVSNQSSLGAVDCTRCMDCLEACSAGALSLRLGPPHPLGSRRAWARIPSWVTPVPVAAALVVGIRLSGPLTLPTATADFRPRESLREPATATCTVQGVKCRGTSNLFIYRCATFPGVASVKTYAGLHKVVLTFDRGRLTPEALRDSINAPVPHPQTGRRFAGVFRCTSLKVGR